MKRTKSKFRTEVIYTSTDEKLMRNVSGWMNRVSRLAKFSVVKKRKMFNGEISFEYQLKLKYRANIRAATLLKIGFNLSSLCEGRAMNIVKSKDQFIYPGDIDTDFLFPDSANDEIDFPTPDELGIDSPADIVRSVQAETDNDLPF